MKMLKEQMLAETAPERASKADHSIQPECTRDRKLELGKEMQERWETQWQEFLKTLQPVHTGWENSVITETTPWDDTKAFLASFEQVAKACRWPREEWAARLLPALSGEAEQACSSLEARDREDYGKVKAAILRGEAMRREAQRQHFRHFCCQEVEDPRRVYGQLQELCCQWLRPEKHTKEQILELLILEQFLASLPVEIQSWIRAGGPDSCSQAVALAEDFLMSQRERETEKWQGSMKEECMDSLEEKTLDAVRSQIYKEAKQNGDGEMNLLDKGSGMWCPTHSSSLLPPGQKVTEAGLAERLMNLKETDMSLHMVEQTPIPADQQTMFWQVLQENGGNVQPLEGLLVPKSDTPPHPQKEEELFIQSPEESDRFLDQDSGDGEGRQLQMNTLQCAGNEPKEKHRTILQGSQADMPIRAEIYEQRCKSSRKQGKELLKGQNNSCELGETTRPACSASNTEQMKNRKLFSKYGRRYCYRSGFVLDPSGEDQNGCPALGGNIQQIRDHSKPQRGPSVEKLYTCSKCGESFPEKYSLTRHLSIHKEKKWHKCPVCRKSFRYLRNHLKVHIIKFPSV